MSWQCPKRCLLVLVVATTGLVAATSIDGQVLHADRMRLGVFLLTDIAAVPQLADGTLHLEYIEAEAYLGRLLGRVSYELDSGDLHIDLHLSALSLGRLILELGGDDSAGGLLDAEIAVTIPGGNWRAARGRGTARLRHGSLLALPGLADLLLEGEGSRGLDQGEADFVIADGRVVFRRLRLQNPSVRIRGAGSIGLDGSLDLDFNPMASAGLLRSAPLVGWLFANMVREITRRAVRVHVGGHLTAPVFRTHL